jgi:two-component system, response regulator PdtaR
MKAYLQVVVVAEDDALVRMLATDVLVQAGFEVIEAENADGALAILQSRGATIDVLFTDVQMPGAMDGLQLAHHVHHRWPAIGVLVASGRATPALAALPPGSRFLAKPYRLGQVVAQVQELAAAA